MTVNRFKQVLTYAIFVTIIFHTRQPLFAQSKTDAAGKLLLQKQSCNTRLSCLIKVRSGTEKEGFEKRGIRIKSTIGDIWSTEATACQFLQLETDPQVIQIEMGGMVIPEYKTDDSSHRASLVNLVQRQQSTGITSPYTGKDIIVGIVDIGFQPDHPTFFDTTGTRYRVKRLWDQLDSSMSGPAGHQYGKLYSQEKDILTFRDTRQMHGTHVAGIAGGSGYGSYERQFAGVAYDADLVFVGIKYYDENYEASALGDRFVANPAIIDAYDYIFKYADSVGKPCVINLSWGMHTGPHDGTSLFDQAVDLLTGRGKLIVGSAGNNGGSVMHLSHQFNQDTISSFAIDQWRFRGQENVYYDIWGSPGSEVRIALHLYDTYGNRLLSSPYFSSASNTQESNFIVHGQDTFSWQLELVADYAGNNSPNITAIVHNSDMSKFYPAISITSKDALMHAWNSGNPYGYGAGGFFNKMTGFSALPGFVSGDDHHTIGENGGTGDNTISVGAYTAVSGYYNVKGAWINSFQQKGNHAGFTSKGPRIDGRVKPDITAPGVDIMSAFNRYRYDSISTSNGFNTGAVVMHGGQKHYYGVASGTSMAAPHVTGIVALMLQANNALSPQEVLKMLRSTAFTDIFTGDVPNPIWGWGKINAYEAVLLVQSSVGVRDFEKMGLILYPNPASDQLQFINLPEGESPKYLITDMSGKTVQSGRVNEGKIALQLDNGLYCVQLNLERGFYRMKFVVVK